MILKPFTCNYCAFKCRTNPALKRHITIIHKKKSIKTPVKQPVKVTTKTDAMRTTKTKATNKKYVEEAVESMETDESAAGSIVALKDKSPKEIVMDHGSELS